MKTRRRSRAEWRAGSPRPHGDRRRCLAGHRRGGRPALHAAGAQPVLAARRTQRLEALSADLGGALRVQTDIADAGQVADLVAAVLDRHGRIDGLVNNAGVSLHDETIEQLDLTAFKRVLDLNVVGVIRLMQAVLPAMRRQGFRRIVNTNSGATCCLACRRRFNKRTGMPFNDLGAPTYVVFLIVLRRRLHPLSLRHLAAMFLERGSPSATRPSAPGKRHPYAHCTATRRISRHAACGAPCTGLSGREPGGLAALRASGHGGRQALVPPGRGDGGPHAGEGDHRRSRRLPPRHPGGPWPGRHPPVQPVSSMIVRSTTAWAVAVARPGRSG